MSSMGMGRGVGAVLSLMLFLLVLDWGKELSANTGQLDVRRLIKLRVARVLRIFAGLLEILEGLSSDLNDADEHLRSCHGKPLEALRKGFQASTRANPRANPRIMQEVFMMLVDTSILLRSTLKSDS